MTLYQCAPDPEDVVATRRLSDGRSLCVFKVFDEPEVRRVTTTGASYEVIAGEVRVLLAYERVELVTRFPSKPARYALAITDDTGAPEKWRTLDTRRTEAAALRLFRDFKEGDDDRRARQVEEHPTRRAGDARAD